MTTEHEGVSPASAGGVPAPDLAALAAAALPALDAARKAFEAAAAPLPPFKRRPVLAGPALNMTGDEDGNTWPEGVGWALSWGCQLTFGRDEKTAVPYVQVSLSDEDRRRGITQRTATRAQVAEFARMLAEQFGEPAGPDPRDAAGLVDVCNALHAKLGHLPGDCYEASVSHALGLVRELAGKVKLRDLTIKAMHEMAKPFSLPDPRDAEIERLRGELAKANSGWDTWRDEQRTHAKRQDNELRVVAERLHKLIGDTEPCTITPISARHLHGLLDRVVAEPSPEIERLKLEVASARSIADEKRAVAEELRNEADDRKDERDEARKKLYEIRALALRELNFDDEAAASEPTSELVLEIARRWRGTCAELAAIREALGPLHGDRSMGDTDAEVVANLRVALTKMAQGVNHQAARANTAEVERLTRDLRACEIMRNDAGSQRDQALRERDNATRTRDEWREEHERADAEVTRLKRLVGKENVSYDGWDQLSRHDAIVRCEEGWQEYLKARDERDRLRQQLDQHLADENSAQAANDRLRAELALVQRRLQRAVNTNSDLVGERDRLRTALEIADSYRPKFRPGQRVRIGLCNGIVVQPKDVTRVQLEGTLYDVDYPTRVVEPILNDDGEMPF